MLLWLALALGIASVAALGVLAINLVDSFMDSDAAALGGGRSRGRGGSHSASRRSRGGFADAVSPSRWARRHATSSAKFVETEMRERMLELERLLARERANASHQLSEQERRLAGRAA